MFVKTNCIFTCSACFFQLPISSKDFWTNVIFGCFQNSFDFNISEFFIYYFNCTRVDFICMIFLIFVYFCVRGDWSDTFSLNSEKSNFNFQMTWYSSPREISEACFAWYRSFSQYLHMFITIVIDLFSFSFYEIRSISIVVTMHDNLECLQ